MRVLRIAGLTLALMVQALPAHAGEPVNLMLNWAPTADHSPFYYAKAQGWYEKAGIDLTIEVGKGSGVSSLKVGSGGSPFGIADLATMLVARSKGADVVALMSIYANTGQTFYWLKSYGVDGAKTFPGHKIGNPPGDASRVMWPAFAKAAGIAPDAVTFVNVGPTAKIAALKSHTVDIISDFYNEHDLKVIEFGSDLGFVNWKDIGLNPYGNSLIINGAYLAKNPEAGGGFCADQPEGVRRLRRRCRAMSEGAARSGLRARQGKPGTAVGAHQVPDDRRVHNDQGAGLDRSRPDAEGLRAGADLSRHGEAVRCGERVHHKAARSVDQDGCGQGQEVKTNGVRYGSPSITTVAFAIGFPL